MYVPAMLRRASFRIVVLLGPAAVLAGALMGAADPEPPTCQQPAPKTIRADPPQPLLFSISCSDAAGASVGYVVDEPPEHGRLEAHTNSPGAYFYWPDDGYEGPDDVTLHATSANGDSEPVEQQINVDPDFNQPPWCSTTSFTVRAGRSRDHSVTCFDPDGDDLELSVLEPPQHGTVTMSSAFLGVTYSAGTGFAGEDPFKLEADDGHGGTATADVVVTVVDQNQAPACRDAFTVARSGKVDGINLVSVCSDVDGDPVTLEVAEQPAHGTVTKAGPAGWQIATEAGFVGRDAFKMRASDGLAQTVFTVVVQVTESFEAVPECATLQLAATAGVPVTIQLQCLDRDGDVPELEIREAPDAAAGTLDALDQQGQTVRFTPHPGFTGTARFVYGAKDPFGPASESATVEIAVSPPAAGGGGAVAAQKDATPPALRVAPPVRQELRTVLDSGVRMVVQLDEPATLTVRALVDARSARRLGLARHAKRPVVIGRATRSVAAGRTALRVKLTRKARRALREQPRRATTVRLIAAVTDSAGNRRELPARVVVR